MIIFYCSACLSPLRLAACLLAVAVQFGLASNIEGRFAGSQAPLLADLNQTNRLLRDNLVIECQRSGIRASFRRVPLSRAGISAESLSFSDPSCRASNNGTHYVLTTFFAECGGDVDMEQRRAYNLIQLLAYRGDDNKSPAVIDVRRRGRSSGDSDDDEDSARRASGSGDGADAASVSEAAAPNDLPPPLWVVRFVCNYLNSAPPGGSDVAPTPVSGVVMSSAVNFSLTLFHPDSFVVPYVQHPLRVAAGGQLHVQVLLESNSESIGLRAVIKHCHLTASLGDGGTYGRRVVIVENGCARDGTLAWVGEDERVPYRRFVFRMVKEFNHFTFLHCVVDACSLTGVSTKGPAIPRCVSQRQYCEQQKLSPSAELFYRHSSHVNSGALVVVDSTTKEGALPPNLQPVFETSRPPLIATAAYGSRLPAIANTWTWASTTTALATTRPPLSGPLPSPNGGDAAALAVPGSDGLTTGHVIGIAVGAFVIGCIAVGSLWAIHTHTDPRRRLLSVPTTEDSGSQTSRSPISV